MFEQQIVTFSAGPETTGSLSLVGATITVDQSDSIGVHIAARNLAQDFGRVTKSEAARVLVFEDGQEANVAGAEAAIVVGNIESSRLLQKLESDGKLSFDEIRGKWESFLTAVVEDPFPGCRKALVIAGSDKRGAIFGAYTLSEQIGVSP